MWMQVWGLCDLTILNGEGESLSSRGNRGGFVSGGADVVVFLLPERLSLRIFRIPSAETRLVSGRDTSWGYDLNRPGACCNYRPTNARSLGGSEQPGERRA